ncbi:MAG TPA: hypothetical protein VGO00_05695 [Kofleriaceae bacterium]|nr:hypothetical protein [Kofleriaceae bacterium]
MMSNGHSDIDALIEDGLSRYGVGDLDGALQVWEQVLALDPDNPQANSYVDYVRLNYELLTGTAESDGAPFPLDNDEPEYQIEILPGEIITSPAPMLAEPLDDGWFVADEARSISSRTTSSDREAPIELELEAEEPPPPQRDSSPVGFDAETREYGSPPLEDTDPEPRRPSEPPPEFESTPTPGFDTNDVSTPTGFAAQLTDVKKRELGFVQPSGQHRMPDAKRAEPPELKMTLRTPPPVDLNLGLDDRMELDIELATPSPQMRPKYMSEAIPTILPPPATANVELSYTPSEPRPTTPDDLIASLPSPKPANVITRDLPQNTRPPAGEHAARTRDMAKVTTDTMRPLDKPVSPTREFENNQTVKLPNGLLARDEPPPMQPVTVTSAPTRDLGLRQIPTRPATEDEPTHESDVVAIRKHANTRPPIDATTTDVILTFDPIGARAEEILEQIDQLAPRGESKEDRTRRRITALIDAAMAWMGRSEFDKAVAAVDLALGEDPNSALAQKLIHRNRDQIMAVFTAFLGDLQRTPVLARPLHELGAAPISPRAAFLLSRIDGTLSLDEILDVSGMPRVEAYRYLCQLFLRGILR